MVYGVWYMVCGVWCMVCAGSGMVYGSEGWGVPLIQTNTIAEAAITRDKTSEKPLKQNQLDLKTSQHSPTLTSSLSLNTNPSLTSPFSLSLRTDQE